MIFFLFNFFQIDSKRLFNPFLFFLIFTLWSLKLIKIHSKKLMMLTFIRISCSIFQFSTHFILSLSSFLIKSAGTVLVSSKRVQLPGSGGGSVAGMGGGSKNSSESTSSLSWSVSSFVRFCFEDFSLLFCCWFDGIVCRKFFNKRTNYNFKVFLLLNLWVLVSLKWD